MIHKFRIHGTNIVVDVPSGAVHVFDDVAYKALDLLENTEKKADAESAQAIREILELKEKGLLFAENRQESLSAVWENKKGIKALCLHVSHDCNMRCGYCFAGTGDFGRGRKLMDAETAKKAIDMLIAGSEKRRNLEVDFFGGEPLLNFDVVRETVLYARSREKEAGKNFRFTITTNALLLNEENKRFINENMDNIVMSIDGRKNINDFMRRRPDGTGTYDRILPKIRDMADLRRQEKYYVRGTFTRHNLDFSKDVLHLADEGFRQISVEPVVAEEGNAYAIREEDLPALFKEYELLAYEYVKRRREGRGFEFFHFLIDLDQGPCVAKRITGCGAGHEYLAVTPDGEIYPCHQFVGMDGYRMGNIYEGVLDEGISDIFRNSNIYTKKECARCWARYYCSGGCAANACRFNGDINEPYKVGCDLEKKRVECALWIKTQEC